MDKGLEMLRGMLQFLVLCAAVGFWNESSAAALAVECRNCTSAQEEQLALSTPGLGIRFIYTFRTHTIRKFKVYLSVPSNFVTDAIPVEPQPKVGGTVPSPSGVAVRTLWEMSVDPDVLSVFQQMDALYASDPNVFTKAHRVDISRLGLTQGDVAVRYFDPRAVAWEYPSGEGFRFTERVSDLLGNASTAAGVDSALSRMIHGVIAPATGAYIEGGTGGGTVGIQFGSVGSSITVDFCNNANECVRVKITVTPNGIQSDFVGARDGSDVMFPAMNERPLRREWGRNGFEPARDMAAFIGNRTGSDYNVNGGSSSCRRVVLACSDAGAQYMCTIYCMQ
jgi:hypothetical protein